MRKKAQRDRDNDFSAPKPAKVLLEGRGSGPVEQLHVFFQQVIRMIVTNFRGNSSRLISRSLRCFWLYHHTSHHKSTIGKFKITRSGDVEQHCTTMKGNTGTDNLLMQPLFYAVA